LKEQVGARGKKKYLNNALIEASNAVHDGYKKVFQFEGKEKIFLTK
jgi:hypothetical protein